MKRLFLSIFLGFSIVACSPSFEEGMGAYTIGDYPEAYKIIIDYAKKGNPEAQNYIGKLYSKGQGVDKNLELAAEWFQKAANKGHADAQNNLGIFYSKGWGVAKDSVYAMALFRQAAENNHVDAQNNLGGILITGQGVTRDVQEGLRWLTAAAVQNSSRAQYNLGMIFSNGMGIKKDVDKGVIWLEKAANNGHLGAKNSLAWIYATCINDKFCDGKKAVALAESVVTKQQNSQFLDTLAASYARIGRFDAAIDYQKKALEIEKANPRLAQEFKLRLKLYSHEIAWPPTEKEREKLNALMDN